MSEVTDAYIFMRRWGQIVILELQMEAGQKKKRIYSPAESVREISVIKTK